MDVIIAGFGGQGVMLIGNLLAYSGMGFGLNVTYMPEYGPEMRGGTANCIAIISDTKISSPILTKFDTAITLNQPSLDKFEQSVKPGGLLIYEASTILKPPTRTDIEIVPIEAANEASKLKNSKVLNMIILGAFLKKKPIISIDAIIEGLKKVLPERYHNLIPLNREAMEKGMELAENVGVNA